MSASSNDTIAAIATAPGRGGIGIVRVSGPQTPAIARTLLGTMIEPRRAELRAFLDADDSPIDTGSGAGLAGPHSFTGEDVLELHGHGGPVVMELLLQRVLALGARPAAAGEFTQRAYLNDKLDLAQAEAIADLIDSGSRAGSARCIALAAGRVLRACTNSPSPCCCCGLWIEAAIDFPEEEIDFLADRALGDACGTCGNDSPTLRKPPAIARACCVTG